MPSFAVLMQRLFISKKMIYALVPMIANLIVKITGYDPTNYFILSLDIGFALLLVIQGLLDIRFGSASDGTGNVIVMPNNASTIVKTNPMADLRIHTLPPIKK